MSFPSTASLYLFVLCIITNVMALLVDYVLISNNQETISYLANRQIWFGTLLIILETLIPVSLGVHFFTM